MGEVCVDYLDTYRKFFDRFTSSVDPSDQLPVKVAGYNLVDSEIAGAVSDWTLQYLEQRRCPPFLIAHLVRRVVEEVRVLSKIDPISCGFRGEVGDYLSLKLMQVCIAKLVDVCSRYRDNAELSSLPPPQPLPLVTTCAIKNSRRSMEDRHVVIHDFHALFNIKGWGPASYYGVLDGHNGIDAAIYSASHLHQFLAESPHYPANPVKALRDACCKTDDLFTIKAERENLHGGTTAVVALLRPKERKLYVAWLGDSQAVIVRQGRPTQIVKPHKPDRTDERDRIEGMGGTVVYWGAWRVNGQLAVSRAIGDVEYKPYVTAEPDIEEITLDGTEDFLILACDGLWDFVTEQEATNAVYCQLQENPEDLEAVSQRLVALSKQLSSQDNISVVVVFLADPAELAKRPSAPMETANPFNGADMFNGQPHHRSTTHPGHPGPFDDEDFGPETDVDMVDDVLLSPAIAAAKALVHGATNANEDDFERQRQQMKEFDDPGDMDGSRDTPTPPAHEVARDANADNLAESGGEESEEEWNYIPGKDSQQQASADTDNKDEEDMSSQLNPNAAEFVPVSPTRLLMMDDAIISASPGVGFEKSLDNIQLPSELDFTKEISQRPGDIDYSNGPKLEVDYFMRDNFSTLRNKSKDFNVSSACSELVNESVENFNTIENSKENIPFDKVAAVQNIEEKVTSGVLEKANIFGTNNDFSNNAFEATNIFGKSDPMTTSIIGLKDFASSPEPEEGIVPGTPRSTTVEAPGSPTEEDISTANHQAELDSPDDLVTDTQKSPDLISPGDGPLEGLTSGQERTSSSGFESESGAEEVETNINEENNEGYITEHRRSPPIDLSFKPIETFSDTNPFGTLQTPSSTTPLNHLDISLEPQLETPKKDVEVGKSGLDNFDFMQNTPSSFISTRSPTEEAAVPFDALESPTDVPHFAHPPNANSSFLATDLPKSPEIQDVLETISPVKAELLEQEVDANYKTNVNDITQELFSDDGNLEMEETSFTTENSQIKEGVSSHVDLDTTEGFLVEESKILQDEKECEQTSKLDDGLKIGSELNQVDDLTVSPKAVEHVLTAFDNIKDETEVQIKQEPHEESRDSDIEVETREMKLEFESHILNSQTTPDDLKNLDDGFEVINKDELIQDNFLTQQTTIEETKPNDPDVQIIEAKPEVEQEVIDLTTPVKETNPFKMDDDFTASHSAQEKPGDVQTTLNNDFLSAIDEFSSAINEELLSSEHSTLLSSSQEPPTSQLEPEATKTVSYQTLTPANEPQITKSATYVTGEEEKAKSPIPDEIVPEVAKPVESPAPVEGKESVVQETVAVTPAAPEDTESPVVLETVQKSEPVQSTVVTETLITALEETSEVPSIVTTEVPSSAGTPPPTPAPGLDDSKELQDIPKTDILVAAVAAAGAVAAGSAIIAEKEEKKLKEGPAAKKTTVGAPKKPSDATAKPSAKTAPSKAPGKPAAPKTTTTTTKPSGTKPATTTTLTKPAPAKTTSTALKKPTSAAPSKPAVAAPKPPASNATKPASTTSKPVPKQLSVNKTTLTTVKPPSKPTTPTTPTTPKSPMLKSDVKSPSRLGVRSPLSAKTSSPAAAKTATEKKPLTNGEIKPLAKKTEVPAKKLGTTTTSKPTAPTKPPGPVAKTTAPVAKAPTSTVNKTAPPKPGATNAAKSKPSSATTVAPKPAPIKRPSTAPPAAKIADKTIKESANKQISSTKTALNGKTAPPKSTSGVKKADPKATEKAVTKPPPIKKPEEVKKEEEPVKIQEDNVTTTNGFEDHIEEESMKIENLSPVIVETVN